MGAFRKASIVGSGVLLSPDDLAFAPDESDETEEPEASPPEPKPALRPAPAGQIPLSALLPSDIARLRAMMTAHFDFIWRLLRRLGVQPADVDDCAQQVFVIAAHKLPVIASKSEQSFLFGIALNVAAEARRVHLKRRDKAAGLYPEARDPRPSPDELLDRTRARMLLDRVLDAMPMESRAVFVLHELEEMPLHEIAPLLSIPIGTAASRLRRGRTEFQRLAARLQKPAARPKKPKRLGQK